MPIVGHAFAGIATAHVFEGANAQPSPRRALARALWVPGFVLLAYLPDIVTQLGVLSGYADAKNFAHSLVFGAVAGTVIGAAWARASGGRMRTLVALAVGTILLHDVLDLLQSDDRMPFWPLSSWVVAPGWLAYRNRAATELALFGLPFAAYEAVRLYRRVRANGMGTLRDITWIGWVAVGLIGVGVLGFQELRRERGFQLRQAQRLLRQGNFDGALAAADEADRWPTGANAGADLVRGEAHDRLGNLALAEQFLLRARQREPESFWAVADLAEYYASHGTVEERQRRSAPYLELLRARFSGDPSYPRVARRLERLLSGT